MKTFEFSLMHLKRRSVVSAEKATIHVQNRTDGREVGVETCQLGISSDARRRPALHLPHQPADAPAAGCDTIDEQTIFDLDEEEEPEEEDKCAAAPCSSSVAGASHQAQKHNGQVLGLAHRLWQWPKS